MTVAAVLIVSTLSQGGQPGNARGAKDVADPTIGSERREPETNPQVEGGVLQGVQSSEGQTAVLTVRHDLKGALTFLTMEYPDSWAVRPDHMSGMQLTSSTPEDIAEWYGQVTTNTWGSLQLSITNEPVGEPAQPEPATDVFVTTTDVTVDGYPGIRRDFQDSAGRVDAAVRVTLPRQVSYMFNTQVAGAAGAASSTIRAELDNVLASVDFIPDYTGQVAWTWSPVGAPSASGNGFDIYHPADWTAVSAQDGGVSLASPVGPSYEQGPLELYVAPASTGDAALWATARRWPYHMFSHETRGISTAGLTTPLPFVPTAAFLVKTRNNVTWLVAVSNPAQMPGSSAYWFYDQIVYRITTASVIAYNLPPYP